MVAHGTESRYVNQACRCPDCKTAHAAQMGKRRAERRQLLAEDPSRAPHGRASTYLNWGCRCEPCKAAQAASKAEMRAARRDSQVTG